MSDRNNRQKLVQDVVASVLAAVDPRDAVARVARSQLTKGPCVAIAVGKAAAAMTRGLLEVEGIEVTRGVVLGGTGVGASLGDIAGKGLVDVFECDHPLPTKRNVFAAEQVAGVCRRQSALADKGGERLVMLLSGGASAYLCLPAGGLDVEDVRAVTAALLRAGATIDELNCVRKHCEVLKGGGIARIVHPCPMDVLVLSDVVGDDLATIGSGPAAPDPTAYKDAVGVLESRGVMEASAAVTGYLRRGLAGVVGETPKPGDAVFAGVKHVIVASNADAVSGAAAALERAGFRVVERRTGVRGEASAVGADFAKRLAEVAESHRDKAAIVWGGETTVTVRGKGKGGRNQEAVLAAAIALDGGNAVGRAAGLLVASFGTDGVDGPTDAAGAFAVAGTVGEARAHGVEAAKMLSNNDSYAFFDGAGTLLRTGATGTNVCDVMIGVSGG